MLVLAGCADGGTTATADTTAPTLSGVQFAATSTTTATVTATVNEAGTLFWVAYADDTVPADAAALIADAGKAKAAPIVANSGTAGHTVPDAGNITVSIMGISLGTAYDFYAVAQDTAGNNSALSAKLDFRTTLTASNPTATDLVSVSGATLQLAWTNPDPTANDLSQISIRWGTAAGQSATISSGLTEGGQSTYAVTGLTPNTSHTFSLVAVYTDSTSSSAVSITRTPVKVDGDNDTLIDIHNLDMLNNARCNLAGTTYLTADSGGTCATSGALQCGTAGTIACTGYELTRNLDFATAGDYVSGTVNNAWRPNAATPATATNAGFVPIGTIFTGIFDGNGNSISNLYVRNSADGDYGLFSQLSGTVRNLGVVNGAVYGAGDVGIVAGQTNSGSTIIASYASSTANGGGSTDVVGGLVGNNIGIIIASYASGTANGGGSTDNVGGLVGQNGGTITASYASGAADGGAGGQDNVGGFVGINDFDGTITASYAIGTADGGTGGSDRAGSLFSINQSIITASYGFGIPSGDSFGSPGSTKPAGVTGSGIVSARKMTMPVVASPPNTAVPAAWNAAASNTLGAWDFGTASQTPALKYADYDGAGTVYSCDQFPTGACGTLIPGQR